jgi:hypothetical protein
MTKQVTKAQQQQQQQQQNRKTQTEAGYSHNVLLAVLHQLS